MLEVAHVSGHLLAKVLLRSPQRGQLCLCTGLARAHAHKLRLCPGRSLEQLRLCTGRALEQLRPLACSCVDTLTEQLQLGARGLARRRVLLLDLREPRGLRIEHVLARPGRAFCFRQRLPNLFELTPEVRTRGIAGRNRELSAARAEHAKRNASDEEQARAGDAREPKQLNRRHHDLP